MRHKPPTAGRAWSSGTTLCLLSLAFAWAVPTVSMAENRRDVWIISGQSNACGRGKLPGPAPDPRVRMYVTKTDEWKVATDPLADMATGGVGPWVFAAQQVARQADVRIDITANGMGGHVIGFWRPDQFLGQGLSKRAKTSGHNAQVFLWYQGESNAGSSADEYLKELRDLVARVRRDTSNAELTVVIIQLASCGSADLQGVREAERQFVIEDGQALLVPALGRSMGDSCHLDKEGYASLGKEIALALCKHRYEVEGINWPGPVMDRAVFGEDPRSVIAHFAEVEKLEGMDAADFVIYQDNSLIECRAAEAGKTLVKLTFAEPVKRKARLAYGGRAYPGSSLKDEAGNRAPAVVLDVQRARVPDDQYRQMPNGAGTVRAP